MKKRTIILFICIGCISAILIPFSQSSDIKSILFLMIVGMIESIFIIIFDKENKWTQIPYIVLLLIFSIGQALIFTFI